MFVCSNHMISPSLSLLLLFYHSPPLSLWHTLTLIRSSSGSSPPSKTQLPSSLSSHKHRLSPADAASIGQRRRHWCAHEVWCALMSDAVWWLMLGEAYSNGETEVRETITTVEEEGKGTWKVGSTLLSSPTVGRGRRPSAMTECLHAGFAFITAGERPDANHKYMTGVVGFQMCLFWRGRGRGRVLCCFMERFCSVCLFVLSLLYYIRVTKGEVDKSARKHETHLHNSVEAEDVKHGTQNTQICYMIHKHTHAHTHTHCNPSLRWWGSA